MGVQQSPCSLKSSIHVLLVFLLVVVLPKTRLFHPLSIRKSQHVSTLTKCVSTTYCVSGIVLRDMLFHHIFMAF